MEPVRDRKVAKRRVQSPTSGNQLFFENREEEGGNAEIYLEMDLPCLLGKGWRSRQSQVIIELVKSP